MSSKLLQKGTIATFAANSITRVYPGLRIKGVSVEPDHLEITSTEHSKVVKKYRTALVTDANVTAEYVMELINDSDSVLTNVAWLISKSPSNQDSSDTDPSYAAEFCDVSSTLRSAASLTQGAYTPTISEKHTKAPTFVVGNLAAGDTVDDCSDPTFLQTGAQDGLALAIAALIAAGSGVVYVRRGTYTSTTATGFEIPAGCMIIGEGLDTIITHNDADLTGPLFSLAANSELHNMTILPVSTPTAVTEAILTTGANVQLRNVTITHTGAIGTYNQLVSIETAWCVLDKVIVTGATVRCLNVTGDGANVAIRDCAFTMTGEAGAAQTEVVLLSGPRCSVDNLRVTDTASTVAGALTRALNIAATADNSVFSNVTISSNVVSNLVLAASNCLVTGLIADCVAVPTVGTELISVSGSQNTLKGIHVAQNTADGTFTSILDCSANFNRFYNLDLSTDEARLIRSAGVFCRFYDVTLAHTGTPTGTEMAEFAGGDSVISGVSATASALGTLTAVVRITTELRSRFNNMNLNDNGLVIPALVVSESDFTRVSDCFFTSADTANAVLINECEQFRLHDCNIDYNDATGVAVHCVGANSAEVISRCKIDRNYIDSLGGGIRLQGGSDAAAFLDHCIVEKNYFNSYVTLGAIILADGTAGVRYARVEDNKILISAAVDAIIVNVASVDNVIERNDIDMGAVAAVSAINIGAPRCKVRHNDIRGTGTGAGTIGIEMLAAAERCTLLGNFITMDGALVIAISQLGNTSNISLNNISIGSDAASRGIGIGAAVAKTSIIGNQVTIGAAGIGIEASNVANTGVCAGNVVTGAGTDVSLHANMLSQAADTMNELS